jgi:hypothetical protein
MKIRPEERERKTEKQRQKEKFWKQCGEWIRKRDQPCGNWTGGKERS